MSRDSHDENAHPAALPDTMPDVPREDVPREDVPRDDAPRDDAPRDNARDAWHHVARESAPLVGAGAGTPVGLPSIASVLRRADRVAAARTVLGTLICTSFVAMVIEYEGWEIIFRANGTPRAEQDIPLDRFLMSSLDTLGGALAVGLGVALLTLLWPTARKRPWRFAAYGMAVGAAGFVGWMAYLTSLAK